MVIGTATAEAPAKAILFGEHSVNRGQSALAASVGLHVRCSIAPGAGFTFSSSAHTRAFSRDDIRALRADVDAWRAAADYARIQALARIEYFAPALYVLANAFDDLPGGLAATWHSAIPDAGGLGSGGASAVAFATALLAAQSGSSAVDAARVGPLAYLGDVIAHGGVASALDTQTALHGGVIRYTQAGWGERIDAAPGLMLVIGNTRERGRTAEANARVREWLAADTTRMMYFEAIGTLSAAAAPALAAGDWPLVGRLMNLNQLVLEKIGVSCESLERLNRAALAAGAFGAKLAGSGGGGIMIALVSAEARLAVAEAINAAGGEALLPPVAVPGARVLA